MQAATVIIGPMATLEKEAPAPVAEHPSGSAARHREWQAGAITKIFEQQAARAPERIAVSCGELSLTYAELNARANQLANCLRGSGMRPGTRVGLFMDRSVNTLVAILGVLKTGAAYVPMDPAYPWERLKFIIDDAGVPLVITERSVSAKLQQASQMVLDIDDWTGTLSQESSANLNIAVPPDSPAYVIYTSGSTGKPKGVLVSHFNIARLFTSTEHWFGFTQDDVWTLFHSYGFDFSVWEIWGALLYGGRVVVVPYWVSRTPETFYQLLNAEKVTVLNQTPSAFRQLIAAEENARDVLPLSLRYVIFGGEALELSALRPWVARHGDEQPQLINMYGITETTVHVTYRRIRRGDVEQGRGSPIGVPIPDLQVRVLDPEMRPVPVGGEGEIYVGGEGVAIGYLNRAELTAERFIPDPFCSYPGRRLYKSGDCARVLENGELEYLGRNDDQIKINGFRVETGDIEVAINTFPSVQQSKVLLRQTGDAAKQLVAYVIWREGTAEFPKLREFLSDKLPAYMIPAKFVALQSFPLTTNGKLDRNALPAPNRTRPNLGQPFVAPRNANEKTLAEIFQTVLNVEPIGIHDSFFELGGDSIRTIQIVARAAKAGLHFTAADLFKAGNIIDLLHALQHSRQDNTDVPLSHSPDETLLPPGIEDAYPMSQLQIGMVYHGQLDSATAVYHDIFSYRVTGSFDAAKLNRAVQMLAERHPILRTSFELSKFSKAMQLVHRHVDIPFDIEDIRHLFPAEQDQAIDKWIEQEKAEPFDFGRAPMLRWKVHVRGKDFFQLSYSSHHAILDGWSLAAMLSEVIESYTALLNLGAPVAAPAVTYKRFVELEQAAVANEQSRKFWSKQLEEFQITTLPKVSRGRGVPGEVRIHPVVLPPDVSQKLHALASQEGLPVKCILLAAHLRFLSCVSGQSDVTTGIVMEGRPSEQDGEKILGLFLNTVPLRMKLRGGTWRELAHNVFRQVTEIMSHRRYPLAEIQRQNGGALLFETAFDMVHFHVYEKVLQNQTVRFVEDKFFEATNFPFFAFFQVEPMTREISLRFDYQPAELTEEQMATFAGFYARILQAIATVPENRYETFSPLSQQEREQWQRFSRGPVMQRSGKDSVVEYIDESCRKFADQIAFRTSTKQIRYRELDQASKRIAQFIQENNTRRCVGLVAERSVEALLAVIGVLRAGEAYVPIDPHQPRSRMEAMLRQTNVSTVLATSVLNHELANCDAVLINELLAKSARQPRISQQSVRRGSLAYVLFTSGSTGVPKGVEISHANLLHSTEARFDYYKRPVRSFLLASPHWFDSSVAGIFWTLAQGGELVVPDEREVKDPAVLSRLIAEHRVSHLLCLPSLYSSLLSYAERLTSLETVIVAGEECPPELVNRHRKVCGAQLYNEYGPTEATVWCSVHYCDGDYATKTPIGRPIANTAMYVLDDQLLPAPIATPGEIYVSGPGVAGGYAGDATLTAKRFVDSPEWIGSDSKLYRTGDLARILPDGNIEFLGRRDQQVKIRGMRVELSEIESAIRKHPAVENCLVRLNQGVHGEHRLTAYVQSASSIAAAQLRNFLKDSLPNHMIPSAYMFMKTLPCTGSGKVDRRALPPVGDVEGEQVRPYVAPSTPFEVEIAKIWSEVLQIDTVGTDWEFLEIGGHSLSAMQVAARIRDRFQVEIPLAEFFRNGTIAGQATMVFRRLAFEKASGNAIGTLACAS